MTKNQILAGYLRHACKALDELKANLILGCRPELAVAMAVGSLQTYQMAAAQPIVRFAAEKDTIRMRQALQLAIAYYSGPEAIAVLGEDQAAALRNDFLQLLMTHEAN
jgi:hypothetical protein